MKVVIVGAGPAGLFAAYRLSAEHHVTILERQSYAGGSGLHSDGKLNFHPMVGGIRDLFRDLGVEMAHTDEEGLKELEAEASGAPEPPSLGPKARLRNPSFGIAMEPRNGSMRRPRRPSARPTW